MTSDQTPPQPSHTPSSPWGKPSGQSTGPDLTVRTDGKRAVRHDVTFTGDLKTFYRLWLVNMALTILTLGFYSPWASVRLKRYLYGHTRLAGSGFTFDAKGRAILIGRLILLGALALAAFLPNVMDGLTAYGIMALVFVIGLPWLVVQSAKFRARNTTWRGVHFDFSGRTLNAVIPFVVLYATVPFTLGLSLPWVRKQQHLFLMGNLTAGGRPFSLDPKKFSYFASGFKTVFIGLFFVVAPALFVGAFLEDLISGNPADRSPLSLVIVGLVSLMPLMTYLSVSAVYRAFTRNILFENTTFDGQHQLHSTIVPLNLGWITLTNLVLTVATLGLFRPIAIFRKHRYLVTTMGITLMEPVEGLERMMTQEDNALGEVGGSYFGTGVDI